MQRLNRDINALIAEQRERFLNGLPLSPGHSVRPEILRSWQRSRKAGVDETEVAIHMLSKEAFRQVREKNAALLETALPVIDILYSTIIHSQTNMLITDANAVILYSKGVGTGFSAAPACAMRGFDAGETSEGTTAMGLCISERRAVYVTGYEHYKKVYRDWHCTAAPVFDAYGELLGTVGFVINRNDLHPHTLGMVTAASTLITEQIKLRLLYRNQRAILDSLNEGVIVLDKKLRVVEMNPYACRIFQVKDSPVGKSASAIVKNEGNISRLRDKAPVCDQDGTFVLLGGSKMHCNLSAERTDEGGLIINLRENGRMQHLAKRFMGTRAKYTFTDILGQSPGMCRVLEMAKTASSSDASVLIIGESGVGKELIAQAIHNNSPRRRGPFIALNCGAIPRDLVQTELFGYEPGAFTGASRDGMIGKFEMADGGTLFLDEIGDMALNMQVNLLRVLQEGIVTRVGGKTSRKVDVRVIAATHSNLGVNVDRGSFRRDLYYRLNVLGILVPPLRERGKDVFLLARFFLEKYCAVAGKSISGFDNQVRDCLEAYHWPGNVRELENIIERATIITKSPQLQKSDLPLEMLAQCPPHTVPLSSPVARQFRLSAFPAGHAEIIPLSSGGLSLRDQEEDCIKKALEQTGGNMQAAAKILGISRGTLYSRLKRYGICPASLRHGPTCGPATAG